MNKYQSQINKAKSMKVLKDVASHIGVKLGNIKDIVKAKAKLTQALEMERREVEREVIKINRRRDDNKYKELRPFNRMRNRLDTVHNVNTYLNKSNGEYQTLAELNEIMWEFRNIKGNIKMGDVRKVAKLRGYSPEEYLNMMNQKLSKFDLNNFSGMLEFYGFKQDEIDRMVQEFNNANYKRQDHLLKIINDFAKGKNKYEDIEDIKDHELARSNFRGHFDVIIKAGRGWNNEKIDEL